MDEVWAVPKDPFSDVYSFTRPGNNVGLLRTSDAKILCQMSVRNVGNALVATGNMIPPLLLLHTLFKTKELKINETLITPSSNEAYLQSWISFLTREVPTGYKDSAAVNICYPDTAGAMNAIVIADNPQSRLRYALTVVESDVIDMIDCSGFNDGGGETYLPSVFKLDLKNTRANKQVVCMGCWSFRYC